MWLLSSPLKITAWVWAVAAAPYLLGGIAPNITNVSAHVSQILWTAGTIVWTAAPLALPVFAWYRWYKKYKEKW
jgi:hypothetical protein